MTSSHPLDPLPPTTRALIDVLRRSLHGPSASFPFGDAIDREELHTCAARHGLTAWLSEGSDARIRTARALAALGELLQVTDSLAAAGIRAIALKGPVFSAWLYGDPGARSFSDLDLLIAPDERLRALRVLCELGYSLPCEMSHAAARVVYGSMGAWPLYRDSSVPLDVHWRLAHRRFAAPLDAAVVIRDAVHVEIAGRRVEMPCATHTATIALVHAAKHVWSSLELVFAIASLMRRGDVDWNAVVASTRRGGAWNAASAGLRLASEIFAVKIPPPIDVHCRANSDVEMLGQLGYAALAMPSQVFHSRASEWRAHRAALDRGLDRVRYDLWRVLAPTILDWQWCRLPDSLVAFYLPLRVVRLAAERVRAVAS